MFPRILHSSFLVRVSMVLASVTALTDWYVDQNAVNCREGTGAPDNPFCSITAAVNAAAAGDTIHIAPGNYVENIVLDKDLMLIGTEGQEVTVIDGDGAAVVRVSNSNAALTGFTITNGFSGKDDPPGAGISVTGSLASLALTNSTVTANTATEAIYYPPFIPWWSWACWGMDCGLGSNDWGWAYFGKGGGMGVLDGAEATLVNSTVSHNSAGFSGAGIFNEGLLTLTNSTVSSNSAYQCGGISNGGTLTLTSSTVSGNTADTEGGGIHNSGALTLTGSLVNENTANGVGGGIHNSGTLKITGSLVSANTASSGGGGIHSSDTLTLTCSTVAGNTSRNGRAGGIEGDATIDHSIIAGNTVGYFSLSSDCSGTLNSLGHNLIGNSPHATITGDPTGNLLDDQDPRFADDYSLQPDSPCVDAGNPSLDLAGKDLLGNPRLLDGDLDGAMVVDIGACEFNNVHLEAGPGDPAILGDADLLVRTTGTPGLSVLLFLGAGPGETPLPPYGSLFFDSHLPWSRLELGKNPSTRKLRLPPSPTGSFVLQGLALDLSDPGPAVGAFHFPGNLSNAVAFFPLSPVADFAASPTTGTAPLSVSFDDLSSGNVDSRFWSFGDGNASNSLNPSHEYAVGGEYTVTLTVTGPGGIDSETKTHYISVVNPPPPVAGFAGSPTSGTAPLSVSFTDLSTGNIGSHLWDFGDGSTSTAPNPSHEYAVRGEYTVALTVTGLGGSGTETKTNYISVVNPPPPVADFTGSPTIGGPPLKVSFTDLSTGNIGSHLWDFGDGNTSIAQNPSHRYASPGEYTVSLTVTGLGGSDTETKAEYVTVVPVPVPRFSGTPRNGFAPLSVDFSDLSTGPITSWSWDFGDGNTSALQNPSHTYLQGGSFTVTLTVAGPGGTRTTSKGNYITVTPTVEFSGTPTSGTAPLQVSFTDLTSGTVTAWTWDFGDGNTSELQNPVHTYTAPGTYSVILVVKGPFGFNGAMKTDYITVF